MVPSDMTGNLFLHPFANAGERQMVHGVYRPFWGPEPPCLSAAKISRGVDDQFFRQGKRMRA